MIVKCVKSEGLAHNSYFIGSGSSAVVIDPKRDIEEYLDLAVQNGMRIKYIFETHKNEDYVIGSLQLAKYTRAMIYHGPGLNWLYGELAVDGQEFNVGKLVITALHTPGHTDESMSYVLYDTSTGNEPVMVFTGDALFIGDTGRVDFGGESETPRMAGDLYDSIYNKILPLGDSVILYPGHGAGSVCGANIADRDESTLGIEKLQNPALRISTREEFIAAKVAERHERPPYFSLMEKYNREGAPILDSRALPHLLTPKEFAREIEGGALVIDTSMPTAFSGAHISGSYSIWLDGLSSFAGWFLPEDKSLLLVLEKQYDLEKAVRYLQRIGYDNIRGVLRGGVEAWYDAGFPIEGLPLLCVHRLKALMDEKADMVVLDVRKDNEWTAGHIEGSIHVFLGNIEKELERIPVDKPVAVICNVGHRAGLGGSILLRNNYCDVYNVAGSIMAWKNAGFPLVIGA